MSNLFIVEGDRLATPDLTRCGVAGVTRDLIFECCRRDGVDCAMEAIALERLLAADEVFVVNSLIGVWLVRSVADTVLRTGRTAHRVRSWLEEAGEAA